MRKNYFLIDVVTKAKCFGFTDEEIKNAVEEGLNNYKTIEKAMKKQKEKK